MTDLTKLTLSEARDGLALQQFSHNLSRESPSPRRGGVRGGVTSLAEVLSKGHNFFPFFALEVASQSNCNHALGFSPPPDPTPQGGGEPSSTLYYQDESI